MRTVKLQASQLTNGKDMASFMRAALTMPYYFHGNLDSLHDCLSDISEDVCFILDPVNVTAICRSPYAYKVMMVISRAAEENPHLFVRFAEADEKG